MRPPEPARIRVLFVMRQRARSHRRPHHHPGQGRPVAGGAGPEDDVVVSVGDLDAGVASLIVRSGAQAGDAFALHDQLTRLGRHPDSEISLDDITVSRRHAEVERTDNGYVVRDAGSLNGTYLNAERIDDEVVLHQGDELQVGKFRLVFFERADG